MNNIKIFIISVLVIAGCSALCSCTGRTADNMKPLGETVRVVIPESDVAEDSAIAAGDVAAPDQPEDQNIDKQL